MEPGREALGGAAATPEVLHRTVVEAVPRAATKWTSVITLINCAVGAGVLSFPFAFRWVGRGSLQGPPALWRNGPGRRSE